MGTKTKVIKYIDNWKNKGYDKGIPDEAPFQLEKRGLVPSYRMICITLMKNPNNLEGLGYAREKCNIYQEIKRNEIYNRNTKNKQLKIFL